MASEKDLELVDQYLGNRLNAQERSAFEKRLETDAALRNEFSLQQKIIDNIRKTRVAELKKLLNDIPVSSIPAEGTSLAAKIGLLVIATALVGSGLYLYLNQPQGTVVKPAETETVDNDTPSIAEPEKTEETKPEVLVEEEESSKQNNVVKSPATAPVVKEPLVQEEPVKPATLDVFDPTEESAKTDELDAASKGKETAVPSILVETLTDKRYNFHYQFKDNKLYLYGSFEKDLYEIMEFFSDNKHTMFLYYKENYYLLNEEDEKVKALAPIKDTTLLQKLKDYRKN
jgi:hypothetical protein